MNNTLKYFEGKICTIFTLAMNRNFKEENPENFQKPLFNYFMGKVESIDDTGLLLSQLNQKTKTFFFTRNIIAIAEEEILNPNNPKDAVVIDNYKASSEALNKELSKLNISTQGPYLDIESMNNLTKKIKQATT